MTLKHHKERNNTFFSFLSSVRSKTLSPAELTSTPAIPTGPKFIPDTCSAREGHFIPTRESAVLWVNWRTNASFQELINTCCCEVWKGNQTSSVAPGCTDWVRPSVTIRFPSINNRTLPKRYSSSHRVETKHLEEPGTVPALNMPAR